jgi:hypothetical protein
MPKKTKKQEKFYLLNISELIYANVNISLRALQRKLEEKGIHLTIGYINKLREKALHQIAEEIDQEILAAAEALKVKLAKMTLPPDFHGRTP